VTELLAIAPEVAEALETGDPVVALETTIVAHGFPPGTGTEVGLECEARVRAAGGVPATVGVLDGQVRLGLTPAELERFGPEAAKATARDLAVCAVKGLVGATTVGGTLAVCRRAGVRFMATGGLGGVHRTFPSTPDVSGDLTELARTETLLVSAGVKSLLDVPATAEVLETLGIPLLGYRTDDLPLFYAPHGGPPIGARVESPDEAARIARAHWALGRSTALVLARPPDRGLEDVEPLIERALDEAQAEGVSGKAVTPFVLAYLHRESRGRTLEVNRELAAANAGLAAEVAAAYADESRNRLRP
jgi:pseudouridine-5'-phosphate glycosidase